MSSFYIWLLLTGSDFIVWFIELFRANFSLLKSLSEGFLFYLLLSG